MIEIDFDALKRQGTFEDEEFEQQLPMAAFGFDGAERTRYEMLLPCGGGIYKGIFTIEHDVIVNQLLVKLIGGTPIALNTILPPGAIGVEIAGGISFELLFKSA